MANDKKQRFELNKGSDREFDISKGKKRRFDLTKDSDDLQVESKPLLTDSKPINQSDLASQSSQVEGANNKGSKKWLIGALVIVALCVLGWWLFSNDNSTNETTPAVSELPKDTSPSEDDETAASDSTYAGITASALETNSSDVDKTSDVAVPGDMPTNAEPVQKSSQTSMPATSVSEDTETEAMKVIRGEYGNNPERKNRLGARYEEIQSRVNQLMN